MRQTIQQLPGSQIREVANAGLGRSDVLAFWFGESDEVTPLAVRQAAIESLARGETFYSHNLGLPELREVRRHYTAALHGDPVPDRIAVTSSGVSALMTVMQLLVDAGDEGVGRPGGTELPGSRAPAGGAAEGRPGRAVPGAGGAAGRAISDPAGWHVGLVPGAVSGRFTGLCQTPGQPTRPGVGAGCGLWR